MSCNFYFQRWKFLLSRLEMLIKSDLEHQIEKAHDQQLSDAVLRVTSIMVQYMKIYSEIMECVQNNLQVQKTEFMRNIVNAIASRILELKRDLIELEGSPFHYLGAGLIMNKQTYDPEMTTVLKVKRSPIVQEAIETALQRAKEKKDTPEEPEVLEAEKEETNEVDELYIKLEEMHKAFMLKLEETNEQDEKSENDVKYIMTEEERVRIDYLNLIKAHEKLRQVTRYLKVQRFKREAWEKKLLGTAAPLARHELRQKAARFVQKIFRAYFKIKRQQIEECKRDQILGLAICKHPSVEKNVKVEQKPTKNAELYEKYEKECTSHKAKAAEQYMIRKGDEVADDFRDRISYWFHEWFESIRCIHEIPKDGSIAIFRDEVPDPYEWFEQYEANNKTKGVKSAEELKYEKQQAKEMERQAMKQEKMRQKVEAAMLKKMMKSPTMHPGYHYKQSKNTDRLLELIGCYHKTWDDYDLQDILEAKRKYIDEINIQEAYMNVQIEILQKVDEYMKNNYLALKNALRKDYENNGETMPEQTNKTRGRTKRLRALNRLRAVRSERIVDKLETLAMQGFVVEYPETTLEDYTGDPNFSGDDYRRFIMQTFPQGNEIRSYWWDRCHAVALGFQKILLVGPKESGKTTLVYALASMNDAVLFELNPLKVPKELLKQSLLTELTKNVLYCAKAVEPSVIYIRHLQKLFCIKQSPEEEELGLGLIKRFFVNNILKKINKNDKITVIGSCSDPWLAKNRQLVKPFSNIVLLPSLSYSLTELLLKRWVDRYPSIPSTFKVCKLAYILAKDQKYSYGYLKKILEEFTSHERLIRISVFGLDAMEVYNYILEHQPEEKVDYERYRNWYFEKTPTGRKEKEHLESQVKYKNAVAELKAKEAKQKVGKRSAVSSAASSRSAL